MTEKKSDKMSLGAKLAYTFGAFGNDVFYMAISTYLINFITSNLFKTGNEQLDNTLIGAVTMIIMILRILELFIDPFIGNAIDRTKTKWGHFRPWIVVGGTISSIIILILFTQMGGLSKSNPWLYLVIFAVLYILMDVFYSFKDVGFWSMLPALTFDSREREKTATMARVGSSIGSALTGVVVMPIVLFFSLDKANEAGDPNGWLMFGFCVCVVGIVTSLCVGFFTREKENKLRKNKQDTKGIGTILKALVQNDQLMWTAIAYIFYGIGYCAVNALELYYFQYIQGASTGYAVAQSVHMVIGVIAVVAFPALASKLSRKPLYMICICTMIVGLGCFAIAPADPGSDSISSINWLVWVADVLFYLPQQIVWLIVLMTITDSVEYAQLKTGHRDESLALSVRPLCDKLGSAVSNGLVGQVAIISCMTSGATAITVQQAGTVGIFKILMLAVPAVILAISIIIFMKKVTLTEKEHARIVEELEKTWGKDNK